jgi:uncharacterized protein
MPKRLRLLSLIVLAAAVAAPAIAQDAATAQWQQRIESWRAQRAHELDAPDGWLSLIGLDWLKPGANVFGAASDNSIRIDAQAPAHFGILTVSGTNVQLIALPEGFPAGFQLNGKPAVEGKISTDPNNPTTMTWRGVTMIVLERSGRFALRVKDSNSLTRTSFAGLHWYAPNLDYAVEARWTPYNPPHMLQIPTIIGTTISLPAPGVAEFTLNGKHLRLEPVLEDPHDNTLFFILRDLTSQTTTYQGARFLRTQLPDHGLTHPGTLILDFNQLYNPPCAYTPYATCPLPPPQNRLDVAIEAGEQRYSH